MYKLSPNSKKKLEGVNPALINVVNRAIELSVVDFGITEGLRTIERQRELVKQKKSQTLKSKHLEGRAVDVVAFVQGKPNWEFRFYEQIAAAMKQAATELGVRIEWGGDWKSFKDGCHFQLKD